MFRIQKRQAYSLVNFHITNTNIERVFDEKVDNIS